MPEPVLLTTFLWAYLSPAAEDSYLRKRKQTAPANEPPVTESAHIPSQQPGGSFTDDKSEAQGGHIAGSGADS